MISFVTHICSLQAVKPFMHIRGKKKKKKKENEKERSEIQVYFTALGTVLCFLQSNFQRDDICWLANNRDSSLGPSLCKSLSRSNIHFFISNILFFFLRSSKIAFFNINAERNLFRTLFFSFFIMQKN